MRGLRDLSRRQDRCRVLGIGRPGRDVDPLLGDLLHLPVERGRDLVATRVDERTVVGRIGTEDRTQLLADLPDEMGRPPPGRDLLHELDRLVLGRLVFGRRVLVAGQRTARLHQVQDVVAALHDLGFGRDDELELGAFAAFGDVLEADGFGIADQVERCRRLGDRRQDRGLGEGQLLERLPEVALGGRLHAVTLVAVEVLVEVRGDDLFLALLAGEGLGQPDRLDDLADLAFVGGALERARREQPRANELLGDGRCATGPPADRVDAGRDDGERIESGVAPEVLVLDRGGRIEHFAGDVLELHQLALEIAEAGQLDLAGPVVDDRLLLELDVVEGRGGQRESGRIVVVRADDGDEADERHEERAQEHGGNDRAENGRDVGSATPRRAFSNGSSVALAPCEAGLHLGPHDSIGA